MLDINRAKQIISSPKDIRVTYHDVPVWLTSCNEDDNTVSVHTDSRPDEIMELPVDELEEK
jgi:small acid-soluble spore protein H (minor)